MKNKLGKREDLKEYHENGELAYEFRVVTDSYCWERTYDNQGNKTSYKESVGYDWTATYFDDQGLATSFKDSSGFSWVRTYDNQGNVTSYKDSRGISWVASFDSQNRITSYKDSSDTYWKRIYKEDGTYKQINL